MYGVSKCFAEAVASYFAYEEGLQSLAIRIGAYDDYNPYGKPLTARDMSALLKPRRFYRPSFKVDDGKELTSIFNFTWCI